MDVRLLQELIECSVCLERMGPNSRVLPCQHTFCLSCLEAIASSRSELRCPECRALVGVPVRELPPNILLIRLLESMKIAARHQPLAAAAASSDRRSASGRGAAGGGVGAAEATAASDCRGGGGGAGGGGAESLLLLEKSNDNPCLREVSTLGPATGVRKLLDGWQPSAKALYNFAGLQQGDLPLKRGDTVAVQKRIDDNWFYGECNGRSGFFPAAYVQVVEPASAAAAVAAAAAASQSGVSEPRGRALYDFHPTSDGEEKDCLKLKKDDTVTIIRRVDANWLEGRSGDRVGIFPTSYVSLNEAARRLLLLPANDGAARARAPVDAVPETMNAKDGGVQARTQPLQTLLQSSGDGRRQQRPWAAACGLPVCAFSVFAPPGRAGSCSSNATVAVTVRHPSSLAAATAAGHAAPPPPAASRSRVAAPCQRSNSDVLRKPGSRALVVRRGGGDDGDSDLDAAIAAVLSPVLPRRCAISTAAFLEAAPVACSGGGVAPSSASGSGCESPPPSAQLAQPASMTAATAATSQKCIRIYAAVFDYKPQRDDEIALEKGHLYKVSDVCRDGWYRGTSLVSGQSGVFPGNYVQAVIRLPKPVAPTSASETPAADSASSFTGCGTRRADICPSSASSAAGRRPLATPSLGNVKAAATVAAPGRALATAATASAAATAAAVSVTSPRLLTQSRLRADSECADDEGDFKPATREQRSPWACAAASISCGGATQEEPQTLPPPSLPPPPPPRKRRDLPAGGSGAVAALAGKLEQPGAEHCALPQRTKYASAVVVTDGTSTPKMHRQQLPPGGAVRDTASKVQLESPLERFRCTASYPAQSDAELALELGDVVLVGDKREDGWYAGIHQRTSKRGLFPASFVEKS